VGDAHGVRETACCVPEALELRARHGIVPLIGAGEVREEAQLAGRGTQAPQALEHRGRLARRKPETIHAGVDLDPEHEALRAARALEELDLRDIVHHELEALPRGLLELLGAERSEEHTSELQSLAYLVCRLLLE